MGKLLGDYYDAYPCPLGRTDRKCVVHTDSIPRDLNQEDSARAPYGERTTRQAWRRRMVAIVLSILRLYMACAIFYFGTLVPRSLVRLGPHQGPLKLFQGRVMFTYGSTRRSPFYLSPQHV